MILKIHPARANKVEVAFAAAVLKAGGLLALPTDTVYGLAVDGMNARAVARLYRLKGREAKKPLAWLAASDQQALAQASAVPAEARRLAKRHWPGGLTLVLPRRGGSLGIRVPASRFARDLAQALKRPFAATSANFSGRKAQVSGAVVARAWARRVDLVIDGGRCPKSKESTVAAFKKGRAVILRQGAVKL